MIGLKDGLLGTGHGGVPCTLTVKNHVFHTGFKQILVVWKSKIQKIDVTQFGDGMELITISPKPFMSIPLDEECMVDALLIYREFEEEKNQMVYYAYHFPKDEELIQEVNEVLPEGTSITIQDKFVVVESVQDAKLVQQQLRTLQHAHKKGIISYLYGLSLVYGTWIGEGMQMQIRFPMQGSVVEYEELFVWMSTWLKQQGYDVEWKTIPGTTGQRTEIDISDWTLLEQFALWQGVEGPLPGRERVQWYQNEFKNYFKGESVEGDVQKAVSQGVLKLRKK